MKNKALWANIIRWGLAAVLLYWVFANGQIDFDALSKLIQQPVAFAGLLMILYLQLAVTFFRWLLLLHSQGIPVTFVEAFRLGMSAQFFQTLAPSTLGADLAKGVFIAKKAPAKKIRGVSTIVVDRIAGLAGVYFFVAINFILARETIRGLQGPSAPIIESIGYLSIVLGGVNIAGILLLPWLSKLFLNSQAALFVWMRKVSFLNEVFSAIALYADRRNYLFAGIALSVLGHALGALCLYGISMILFPDLQMQISTFFLGAAAGTFAMDMPLSPSGLGVGQVAFGAVFVALGWPNSRMGASLVTGFQILIILVNTSGILFAPRKIEKAEIQSV